MRHVVRRNAGSGGPITLGLLRISTPVRPAWPPIGAPLQEPTKALWKVPLGPLQVGAALPLLEVHSLTQRAATGLLSNIVEHPTGRYLSAGQHQFRSLWSRDFCWSVPGLLTIDRGDVVRDHLRLLISSAHPETGLVPRALDSINPKMRVVRATLAYAFGLKGAQAAPTKDLVPEYHEQNGHPCIDGNLLTILATLAYVDATGDRAFLAEHAPALQRILRFYDTRIHDGLIVQPGFSDWQDSVRRDGKTFYTNLLWSVTLTELAERGLLGVREQQALDVRTAVHATFFDEASGLYRSLAEGPQLSIDGNLLAIDLGFLRGAQAHSLYAAMKRHPLWSAANGLPGVVTMPDYPWESRNWTVRIVGLGHYHDRLAWSWITAMSAKVASRMGDQPEAERILDGLDKLIARDHTVAEIYEPQRTMKPWQRWLYHSERPFSWGAAATLDAASVVARNRSASA